MSSSVRLVHLLAGVVDQDVEAAEGLDGAGHEVPHQASSLMSPGSSRQRRPSASTSALTSSASGLLGLEVAQGDVGAFAREGDGGGAADAGIARPSPAPCGPGAGRGLVARLAVVGLGVHGAGEAGCRPAAAWGRAAVDTACGGPACAGGRRRGRSWSGSQGGRSCRLNPAPRARVPPRRPRAAGAEPRSDGGTHRHGLDRRPAASHPPRCRSEGGRHAGHHSCGVSTTPPTSGP